MPRLPAPGLFVQSIMDVVKTTRSCLFRYRDLFLISAAPAPRTMYVGRLGYDIILIVSLSRWSEVL